MLRSIDEHVVPIITLCSAAMVFNYAWFYGAYRLARRDRLYSIPLLWFGPEFRSFPYLAIWAVTTAGCLAWLYAVRRAPRDAPAAPTA